MKEPHCNKDCPNKCSSNYWKVYDAKKRQWKIENTVTVQCGKFKRLVKSMNYVKKKCLLKILVYYDKTIYIFQYTLTFLFPEMRAVPSIPLVALDLDVQQPATVKTGALGSDVLS